MWYSLYGAASCVSFFASIVCSSAVKNHNFTLLRQVESLSVALDLILDPGSSPFSLFYIHSANSTPWARPRRKVSLQSKLTHTCPVLFQKTDLDDDDDGGDRIFGLEFGRRARSITARCADISFGVLSNTTRTP